jgi:hypothetical protein
MKDTNKNPMVRVSPSTRRKLKILAVYYDQTMQDLIERLADQEMQHLERDGKLTLTGEQPDEKKGE